MGLATEGFARVFGREAPDLLLVLGDRFEMFAAAAAAVPFVLPIAHVHGGERTAGAIDDVLRHAMTKMAHLHFVSAEAHARRVCQLGEEAWRVVVSGAPALDELLALPPVDDAALSARVGVDVTQPFALCTFHPVTLEPGSAERQGRALLDALDDVDVPVVFTMPNADSGGRVLRAQLASALATHPRWRAHESLGLHTYGAVLARAAAVVGNSSSGIIEAPSFHVPVVNIGARQAGRTRSRGVVDVDADRAAIADAVRAALLPASRAALVNVENVYGDGHAADRIVERLMSAPLDQRLIAKGFVDLDVGGLHAA
jgi:UDP-hydrolysing UDP-N-acetyl-D-glucosamine 2-epimerase